MWSEGTFGELPDIQTERLLLRKVTIDDAPDLLVSTSDPEVARYTTWEPYDSVKQAEDFLRSVISNYERGEPANWGLELRENERFIGMCGFMADSWDPEHARASLGYAIGREHWGAAWYPRPCGRPSNSGSRSSRSTGSKPAASPRTRLRSA